MLKRGEVASRLTKEEEDAEFILFKQFRDDYHRCSCKTDSDYKENHEGQWKAWLARAELDKKGSSGDIAKSATMYQLYCDDTPIPVILDNKEEAYKWDMKNDMNSIGKVNIVSKVEDVNKVMHRGTNVD